MNYLEKIIFFLGLQIKIFNNGFFLYQEGYCKKGVKHFYMKISYLWLHVIVRSSKMESDSFKS